MHIAKVIPLKRLPRGLDVFDYIIPENLESSLAIGQLVHIPFRTSTLFGIVAEITKTSKKATSAKPISDIISPVPFLSKQHISFLYTITQLYGISLATAATMGMLPLQKRKIGKVKIEKLKDQKIKRLKDQKIFFERYTNQSEHSTILKNNLVANTLIIVPEVHHIQEVFDLLPKDTQEKTLVWHSKLSVKEQFERWVDVRNGAKKVILGTRGAVFLPFQKLDSIIIDFEHDENLKHWDQAPRFHVKDVAQLLAKLYGAAVTLTSFSPSVETYFHVHKKNYEGAILFTPPSLDKGGHRGVDAEAESTSPARPKTGVGLSLPKERDGEELPSVVNMSDERRGGNYEICAEKVFDAIQQTIQEKKDVFLFINRKGYATSVGCTDCGHRELCLDTGLPLVYHQDTNTLRSAYTNFQKPMVLVCPKCNSPMVKLFGVGTEQVETGLRKAFSSEQVQIIRVDSEANEKPEENVLPRIIIGTEAAFPHIEWEKTGLVVFIEVDRQLALPEFNAGEHVWHLIAEVQYRKNATASFYIQTVNPAHLIFKSLNEPDRFYRTDLNFRSKLGYPPYNYIVRYFYGDQNPLNAKKTAEALYRRLTEDLKSSTIHPPLEMHPRYYRGQYWYAIIVKLDAKKWYTELTALNKRIPSTWKIDPNPISLLSP